MSRLVSERVILNNKKRSYPLSNLYLGYNEKNIELKKFQRKNLELER